LLSHGFYLSLVLQIHHNLTFSSSSLKEMAISTVNSPSNHHFSFWSLTIHPLPVRFAFYFKSCFKLIFILYDKITQHHKTPKNRFGIKILKRDLFRKNPWTISRNQQKLY